MKQHDLRPFVLPSRQHQFLNPPDNSFHAVFKRSYYSKISALSTSVLTNRSKLRIALQSYNAISGETVSGMFVRCGLISPGSDKRKLLMNLMCEGLSTLRKKDDLHLEQLRSYLVWCEENNYDHLCSSLTEELLISLM